MEKITKRQMFEAIIRWADGEVLSYTDKDGEVVEVEVDALRVFAEHEIQLLDKKAEKAKESAAKRKKEDPLYDAVKFALNDEFKTIADITEDLVAAGHDVTVAKVTYRLSKLVEAGEAEKAPIKVGGEGTKTRTVQGYRAAATE